MIVIAILGLLIPGYALARALRSPVPWAVAFPMSVLLLTEVVIAFVLLGIPIRFGYVLGAIVLAIIISLAVEFFRSSGSAGTLNNEPPQDISKSLALGAGVLVGLVLLGICVRSYLYPLSGPDTALRWDALPRLMLEYQGLSYYPPLTSEDFAKYFVPDSFPPLVATVYWWLYAAWGEAFPRLTSVSIVLQAATCFALVFYTARMLFGSSGGFLSLIVLSSSVFLLEGVWIGQENGFMAISFAGQLLFAFAAVRQPKANLVVICGLFAGLGALAREYGPLLSLGGFAVLASRRETRRYLLLFCLVTLLSGAPWYLRIWALTGNPIYPLDTGLGLPINPVLGGIRAVYHKFLGLDNYSVGMWLWVAGKILIGAPLALLLGVPGIFAAGKSRIALGIPSLIAIGVWLTAVPNTAGGIYYTWRFSTPAWVALSIAAGALGPWMTFATTLRKRALLAVAGLALVICGGYASLCCWTEPLGPKSFPSAVVSRREDPLDFYGVQLWVAQKLEDSNLPAVNILTEDCNLAIALQRKTRFHPILVWSPEVAFIFHPGQQPNDVRRQLIEKNVWLVAVTYLSLNNKYLIEFPFYKDIFENSKPIVEVPESMSIIFLPKQVLPETEANHQ